MKLPGQPRISPILHWTPQQRQDLVAMWVEIGQVIGINDQQLQALLGSTAYMITNVTADRSYDANATTVDELADVLGTLVADLQGKGILT